MRLRKLDLLGACVTLTIFVIGGHFGTRALIGKQQADQLRELADTSLRRAEAAVSFGATTLDDIARDGHISCEPSALQAARLHVYQHSTVKDIRILEADASIRCSAYPETLEFDQEWITPAGMLPARDPGLRLFRVEQFSGTALGVSREFDGGPSVASIVGIDPSVFDIMPRELRERSTVTLELAGGQQIARQGITTAAQLVTIEAPSQTFPLRTRIAVDAAALATWHDEPYLPIMLACGALGLVFGLLLARMIGRGPDPLAELDDAITDGHIRPYFQPVFNLQTSAIVGCEALARWVRPDGTIIPPARFIPLAETSGRIEAITWQLIATTLDNLAPILRADRTFRVSVNIAPDQLVMPGFAARLKLCVATAAVSPDRIVLEITERQHVEDLARTAQIVAELRAAGFRIALDDVGVGHSGLSQIQALGADIIKIDKFFVDAIGRDPTATAVIEMLVRLARELSMNVVAEGIEQPSQRHALAACGVQLGQGYLVSPPLPLEQFLVLLRDSPSTQASTALVQVA